MLTELVPNGSALSVKDACPQIWRCCSVVQFLGTYFLFESNSQSSNHHLSTIWFAIKWGMCATFKTPVIVK